MCFIIFQYTFFSLDPHDTSSLLGKINRPSDWFSISCPKQKVSYQKRLDDIVDLRGYIISADKHKPPFDELSGK